MENQSKIVVLRKFDNLIEAQQAADILMQNNIKCFLSNQLDSQFYSIFSGSNFGVRVNVFERDFDVADELLSTFLQEN